MKAERIRLATALLLALGCRPTTTPSDARAPTPPDVRAPSDASPDVPPAPLLASVVARSLVGSSTIDSTLRMRASDGAGAPRLALPGDPGPGLSALTDGRGALPGDVIATGAGGHVSLIAAEGASVTLTADSVAEVPAYAGATLLLTRGVMEVVSEGGEAVRVDTPSARVIVSSGRCRVGVSLDGSVAVWAETAGVTVWASPPPPPPRPTRLSDAERERLRARTSHPVLLDVDIPELAAQQTRPVVADPLPAGVVRAFDSLGGSHRHPLPPRPTEASFLRWVAQEAPAAAPYAHLLPIGQLSRAGAGDLADVRVVLARFQVQRGPMSVSDRELLLSRMSLALGRATARARRGRDLATRGGDSTALVQLAPVEAVTEAARALAPLRLR